MIGIRGKALDLIEVIVRWGGSTIQPIKEITEKYGKVY